MIVRRIEPVRNQRKQRVAAYARVSTDQSDQQESFETQVAHYANLIRQNPDWEFVKVYADPGRSGTSAKKRPGFMEMIADAKGGKLDIILVKSISRFARNVADAQTYVHVLRAHEVEVRFEREALSSFDPSADMVFNLLAIVAQEESRSISENVKWTYRKNAEKGIRRIGNNRVLGYDAKKDGTLVPNKDAWIVRQIFTDYAAGLPTGQIIGRLNEKGVKRMRSKAPFNVSAMLSILNNELYMGDRVLQKRAPLNYLTKRPDPTVAYTSYRVKNDHEPIISSELWRQAQERLIEQKNDKEGGLYKRSNTHFLYGRVFCADCGAPYKRRTIARGGAAFKAWNCAERQKGKLGNGCENIIIREDELLKAISEKLGWAWVDAERFDADRFMTMVRRVEIGAGGVAVELVGAA